MSKKNDDKHRNAFINIPDDGDDIDDGGVIDVFRIEKKKLKEEKKPLAEVRKERGEKTIDIIEKKDNKKAEIIKKEKEYPAANYKYSTKKHIKRSFFRRKKSHKRNKKTELTVMLVYATVGFIICSLLIMRYSYICKIDAEIRDMKDQIESVEAVIEEKALEVSIKDDISAIEKIAKTELGMFYPNAVQIQYVDLTNN